MVSFNEGRKKFEKEDQYEKKQKLSSILVHRYLIKFEKEERENLKSNLKILCGELVEQDIIVPIDFDQVGDSLYSETLDRELLFFESAGVIEEIEGSIIYKITDKGMKLSNENSGLYKDIPPTIIKNIDDLIDTMFNDNNQNR